MTLETTHAQPVPVAVNAAGASNTTGRLVGDRQKTAQRLLRSSAERAYNGELDIDWDAPAVPRKYWSPDHRQTLYGTKVWDKLSPEQRHELGKHEAVAVLSFGILAEVGLSMMLMRSVIENPVVADDHCRYALVEVGEESRHSTMFSRLINKTGVEPYTLPRIFKKGIRLVGLVPSGPVAYAGTLLIEEVLDRLQREGIDDESLQPHFRQLMKIHVLEEARHITYAREEMVRSMESTNKWLVAFHRGLFSIAVLTVLPALVNPKVYRSIGLSPLRGAIAAQRSPHYRARAEFSGEPLLRFAYEAGFVKGAISTRIMRLARALPQDIVDELAGHAPRQAAA